MYHALPRRTTPGVVRGHVRKKNRTAETRRLRHDDVPVRVCAAGRGWLHVLRPHDVRAFMRIVPGWDEIAIDLKGVVLSKGDAKRLGSYLYWEQLIHIVAWPNDLWKWWDCDFVEEHLGILRLIGVEMDESGDQILCKFTVPMVRAFQLLHIFMHEVGHHCDWTSRRFGRTGSIEAFAEANALRHEGALWRSYVEVFGDPRRSRDT